MADLVEMPEGDSLPPSLRELVEMDSLKWIFVGGKGGVGKTTTSCSVALELAKRREKVLILSTDPAHNLSDAFSQKFSNTPTPVTGVSNLFAMELDSKVQESMAFKLQGEQFSWMKLIPELVSALPGIDEALGFAELIQAVQSMDYSVIIFDTAPTGHTLRLLAFPDMLERALKQLSSLRDHLSGAFSMLKVFADQQIDENEIQSRLDAVKAVTTSVREMFQDPMRTTFVCVCIPEFLSVYETERLVQELARQGIDCSHIVVNQVIFPVGDGQELLSADDAMKALHCVSNDKGQENQELREIIEKMHVKLSLLEEAHHARRVMQSKYLQQIVDLYGYDFHVACMPMRSQEVRGIQSLQSFGAMLLEERELPIVSE